MSKYYDTLHSWGLKKNPFRDVPPIKEPELLASIFYGRQEELDIALPFLFEERNVLVEGAWGIGKTTLLLVLLQRFREQIIDMDESALIRYVGSIPGSSTDDFYRHLAIALADALGSVHKNAHDLALALRGYTVETSVETIEGKVNFGIVQFGGSKTLPTVSAVPTVHVDTYAMLGSLLNLAEDTYGSVILAVDDLDKRDPAIVREILEGGLDLFRTFKGRAFILTGRGANALHKTSLHALGVIAKSIELEPMKTADMKRIATNCLNTVRSEKDDHFYPFTDEVMEEIVLSSEGIPRRLNFICGRLFNAAASRGYDAIDAVVYKELWSDLKKDVSFNVTPHIKYLLDVASKQGSVDENISDKHLERMGVYTFIQLLPLLEESIELQLMTLVKDKDGYRYCPTRLYDPSLKTE